MFLECLQHFIAACNKTTGAGIPFDLARDSDAPIKYHREIIKIFRKF